MHRVTVFRDLLAATPVDKVQVRARPSVLFRMQDTWLLAIVRYLVPSKHASSVKSLLIPRLVEVLNADPEVLNADPDRVRFPAARGVSASTPGSTSTKTARNPGPGPRHPVRGRRAGSIADFHGMR